MKTVGPKDFYEVKRMNLMSDLAWQYATELYLPLLGPIPFAVYRMLYDDETSLTGKETVHSGLFVRGQLSIGEFYHALECLEALALVKTYYNDDQGIHYFVYAVYAPKSPRHFFKDVLLSNVLRKYIGDDSYKKLKKKYSDPKILDVFKDVSAKFSDVYSLDQKQISYGAEQDEDSLLGSRIDVSSDFNILAFFSHLAEYGIRQENLSPEEKTTISKYGGLFQINPEEMAEVVSNVYDYSLDYGSRIDSLKLQKECLDTIYFPYLKGDSGDSKLNSVTKMAVLVREMDNKNPIDWLRALQNGSKPVDADVAIVVHLVRDLGLAKGVVNALVSYVLQTGDNVLSWKVCDKLGAALKRSGVKTAIDAMDYLNHHKKKFNGTSRYNENAKMAYDNELKNANEKLVENDEETPEDNIADIIKKLQKKK